MNKTNNRKPGGQRQTSKLFALGALLVNGLLVNSGDATENDSLVNLLPQSCYLSGAFKQSKQLADIPKPLNSNGEFVFNCQQGLIWTTTEPHRETLVYRRDGRHHILIPNSEPERLKGRIHRELGKILNNLIGADIEYLRQHFEISTNSSNSYTLVPENKRLRNHIGGITVVRKNSAEPNADTEIAIDQDEESMVITIQQSQDFTSLNLDQCGEHFSVHIQACTLLFQ